MKNPVTLALLQLFIVLAPCLVEGRGLYQYGVWRPHDKILTLPYVDGVIVYMHWNVMEPEEGEINLEPIREIRSRVQALGKRFILRVVTSEHTPPWVFSRGVPAVIDRTEDSPKMAPLYWHALYLRRLEILVNALGGALDGDPSLAGVQIGIAGFGEMVLGGDDWLQQGFTPSLWTETCRSIIDIYRNAFRRTPLLVMIMSQEFSKGREIEPMEQIAEYAASKGIGLQFNGLSEDNSYLWGLRPTPDPCSAIGLFRRFAKHVPISFELTNDKVDPHLSLMNALSEGAGFVSVHTSILERPSLAQLFTFTSNFLGKRPRNSSCVWTVLRQTFPGAREKTGKKNYEFGLSQMDGTSVDESSSNISTCLAAHAAAIGSHRGRPCRRTDYRKGSRCMSFKMAGDFDAGTDPVVTVIYSDEGSDTWTLGYSTGPVKRTSDPIRKGNSGRWLRVNIKLVGFRRGADPDFFIDSNMDGDEYIHFVQVTRGRSDVILPYSEDEVPSAEHTVRVK